MRSGSGQRENSHKRFRIISATTAISLTGTFHIEASIVKQGLFYNLQVGDDFVPFGNQLVNRLYEASLIRPRKPLISLCFTRKRKYSESQS
jgi:hypothetical protein